MKLQAKYSNYYDGCIIKGEIEETLGGARVSRSASRPEPTKVIFSHNQYFTYSSRWSLQVRKRVRDRVLQEYLLLRNRDPT